MRKVWNIESYFEILQWLAKNDDCIYGCALYIFKTQNGWVSNGMDKYGHPGAVGSSYVSADAHCAGSLIIA